MNERPNPDAKLAITNAPFHRIVGDEVFVLTRDSQMHWLKNATARYLWDELVKAAADGLTARELAESLSQEFEVESEAALPDVIQFVAHLAERGVLAPASHPPEGD